MEDLIVNTEKRINELEELSLTNATDYVKLASIEEEKAQLDELLLKLYDELLELL